MLLEKMGTMKDGNVVGGGLGHKHCKGSPHHQGFAGMADYLVGALASKLSVVVGLGCLCFFACILLFLATSRSCTPEGAVAGSYCGNDGTCFLLQNSSSSHLSKSGQSLLAVKEKSRMRSNESIAKESTQTRMRSKGPTAEESRQTSLDRIVFGIGASANLWVNRSHFVNLWWKKGKTRGYVWFDDPPGPAWNPSHPPYKVSEDTSNFEYTCTDLNGHRGALRISRIVSETFRLGLPNVDWFVMGDDDTVFFTENLVSTLSKYDPKQLWYIGSTSEDHLQNQDFSYTMAYGGGGFAISYPLAKILEKKQDACMRRYPWLYGSDDRMKACMSEIGVPLTREPGFHQFDIRGEVRGLLAAHPLVPVISLHHLEEFYPLFPNHTRSSGIAHLMKAAQWSPFNMFQQSICYDETKSWSFSISWGYAIQVYKGFVTPNLLEIPTLTFLSWRRRREQFAFRLNTRSRERDICDEPTSFFMKRVRGPQEDGLIQTSYDNSDRIQRVRNCKDRTVPIFNVKTIKVFSEPVERGWIKNPRRPCCRVKSVRKKSVTIHLGACEEGEWLVPQKPEVESRIV